MAQLAEALRYKPVGRGFDSRWGHWKFFIVIILPAALRHWGRLCLWHEWVTGIFPGGKGGRCWPYHLHVSNVLKSKSLNLLEPSWIALPLLFIPPHLVHTVHLSVLYDAYNNQQQLLGLCNVSTLCYFWGTKGILMYRTTLIIFSFQGVKCITV